VLYQRESLDFSGFKSDVLHAESFYSNTRKGGIIVRVITKLEPIAPPIPRLKRVAAYARVSSGKDAMLHSLSAQVSYYSDYIQRHGEWEYVGVYADEAFTGTKEDRPEFQRLINDCRDGKIDMVITKSIARFGRNTVTLLGSCGS